MISWKRLCIWLTDPLSLFWPLVYFSFFSISFVSISCTFWMIFFYVSTAGHVVILVPFQKHVRRIVDSTVIGGWMTTLLGWFREKTGVMDACVQVLCFRIFGCIHYVRAWNLIIPLAVDCWLQWILWCFNFGVWYWGLNWYFPLWIPPVFAVHSWTGTVGGIPTVDTLQLNSSLFVAGCHRHLSAPDPHEEDARGRHRLSDTRKRSWEETKRDTTLCTERVNRN